LNATYIITPAKSPNVHLLNNRMSISFAEPTIHEESDLNGSAVQPDEELVEGDMPEFQIVSGGSIRQGEKLISRDGYSYGKDGRPKKSGAQRWRCTVRNKTISCAASVLQSGEIYMRGPQPHKCTPNQSSLITAEIRAQLREQGKQRPFASGSTLVAEALQQHIPTDHPINGLPTMHNLSVQLTTIGRKDAQSIQVIWNFNGYVRQCQKTSSSMMSG
jgi:hypothetical protein